MDKKMDINIKKLKSNVAWIIGRGFADDFTSDIWVENLKKLSIYKKEREVQ